MSDSPFHFHSTAAFVKDIEQSKRFYTQTLGQEVDLDFGKNVIFKCGITLWEINPHHIIPESVGHAAIRNEHVNRFEFYFETEDVDAAYARLQDAGVTFLHAVHEEPWGQRTVRFYDPDRHLIEVGESMATFVNRLRGSGMSAVAVAAKTGVPLEKVRKLAG